MRARLDTRSDCYIAEVPSRAIKDAQIVDEILKGYMVSDEFSRGTESIRAEGGFVMVGNFDNSSSASATFSALCPATGATTRPSMTGSTPMLPAGTSPSSIPMNISPATSAW